MCGLGFSLVGMPVGMFVGSSLMFGGLLCFGCWLLLLRRGKTFAIYQVVFVSDRCPFPIFLGEVLSVFRFFWWPFGFLYCS